MLAAALVVTTAAATAARDADGPGPTPLDSTNWTLASIVRDGVATPVADGMGATLGFVRDQAGGTVGCDRYSVPYASEASSLTFGAPETTRERCDAARSAWVGPYFAALGAVRGFDMAEGSLDLLDADGTTVLAFEPAPMPSLEGSWVVTGFHDGSALAQPSPGSVPSLAFLTDGRLLGDGGCNEFRGSYALSEEQIAIGTLMSAVAWCSPDLDAQEVRLLESLQQSFTWTVADGSLELRGYEDDLLVTAEPSAVWAQTTR
jgi:heat shock protein HslJ